MASRRHHHTLYRKFSLQLNNTIYIKPKTVPNLSALRSTAGGPLVVPRTRLQLGNLAFCVAGPVTWNSRPLHIRLAPTFFINFQKHAQDTSFLAFLLHRLTVSRA